MTSANATVVVHALKVSVSLKNNVIVLRPAGSCTRPYVPIAIATAAPTASGTTARTFDGRVATVGVTFDIATPHMRRSPLFPAPRLSALPGAARALALRSAGGRSGPGPPLC